MEVLLKSALKTTSLRRTGRGGGGCINDGEAYITDNGEIFVKRNGKKEARRMFDGEFESLKAIFETGTIRVPKPIMVLDNPNGGAVIVMEYISMSSLNKHSEQLGEQLARLHLYNEVVAKNQPDKYIEKFGFHCTTCCGFIPQDNTWSSDWVTFYTEQKLQQQINMINNDRKLLDLWSRLKCKIPNLFEGLDMKPSLLHGDLWGGNASETVAEGVIFDPASFYGHSEFDLAISKMFGGFGKGFFDAYHKVIPKAPGFDARSQLYQLFHYLNHWNHFGEGYRSSSISLMERLIAS